ncbi:MAG: exopolysaccharide biosynthesis polyprenyl glycosylphosphotransferase [Pseudomonadota bacterium]
MANLARSTSQEICLDAVGVSERTLPYYARHAIGAAFLCVSELVAVLVAMGLGYAEQAMLRQWLPFQTVSLPAWLQSSMLVFAMSAMGSLFYGCYSRRESFWESARLAVVVASTAVMAAVLALYLLKVAETTPRSLVMLGGINLLVVAPLSRLLALFLLNRAGVWCRHVVVMGTSSTLPKTVKALEADFALGYRVVAQRRIDEAADELANLPCVDEVVIVPAGVVGDRMDHLAALAHRAAPFVTVVPDLQGLSFGRGMTRFLFDSRTILLTSRNLLVEPANIILKRTFDLLVSALCSILVLPLMAVIAVAVRLESPGPALFVQERIGLGGRRFKCFKFRTMYIDAEERLARMLAEDPATKEEWDRYYKLRNDPRVTRVGNLLRKTSLDELPQFFNVLFGQMSLVGPRPLPAYHFEKLEDISRVDYVSVTPGITGLWQVSGRSSADLNQMASLNSWYARNWSLWLDTTILLRTIPAVLSQRGAY